MPKPSATVDAVAAAAQDVRLARIVITILIAPLWLVGAVAGITWTVAAFAIGAIRVGFTAARTWAAPPATTAITTEGE